MADQLETLQKLQDVDGRLYQLRLAKREKPRELEVARQAVAAQDAQLKALEEQLKALQLRQKDREVELQTREGNVKKLQGQLFQVKTNKEYSTMQHEIDTLKADNSLLEEEILRTFDSIDGVSRQRREEAQRVADAQRRLQQETARVEQELAALDAQIADLERERQAIAPNVPPPTLELYERILALRDGLALVPVTNESCGGCHRRLPPQVVNEVYLKARLVMCETCNRILYQPPG